MQWLCIMCNEQLLLARSAVHVSIAASTPSFELLSHSMLQILYNRALVQLGMCAFRHGMIKDAHSALADVHSPPRPKDSKELAKELLAQVGDIERVSSCSVATSLETTYKCYNKIDAVYFLLFCSLISEDKIS